MKKLLLFGLMFALLVSLAQAITLTASPTTASTTENQTLTVTLTADGNATFSKNSSFGSFSTTGPATSTTFTFSPGFDSSNVNRAYSFLFTATNASNSTDMATATTTLTFTNQNRAPTVNAGADLTVARNTTLSITGTASDPDGDTLTFDWEVVSAPSLNWDLVFLVNTPIAQFIGEDAGNYTFRLIANDSTTTTTDTMSIQVTDAKRLVLTDLDFDIGSDNDDNMENAADGAGLRDAQPGDKVTIDAEVTNGYADSSDIEIRDISMTVTIENIDDGDDLDDETDDVDVQAGRNKNLKLTFTIPERVDTDNYNVIVDIVGRDEMGITHRIVKRFVMGIDKESHDLRVDSADLRPQVLSCTRKGTLDVVVINFGDEEEDEVKVTARSDALDLDFELFDEGDISMGTGFDDDADLTAQVPVDATGLAAGTYPVTLSVYRDTNKLEDTKTVDVVVQACTQPTPNDDSETPVDDEPEDVDVIVTPGTGTTQPPANTGNAPVYAQVDTGFGGSSMYLVLLGAGAILLLVIVIGIIAMLFRK
ncbi:MAG: hypothetical protein Q7S65_04810 [Nanoarchaeota archaeon]|nr:hypothetical protein [Nanoarchaeota archaeon]